MTRRATRPARRARHLDEHFEKFTRAWDAHRDERAASTQAAREYVGLDQAVEDEGTGSRASSSPTDVT
jgi:hypothetical protein